MQDILGAVLGEIAERCLPLPLVVPPAQSSSRPSTTASLKLPGARLRVAGYLSLSICECSYPCLEVVLMHHVEDLSRSLDNGKFFDLPRLTHPGAKALACFMCTPPWIDIHHELSLMVYQTLRNNQNLVTWKGAMCVKICEYCKIQHTLSQPVCMLAFT